MNSIDITINKDFFQTKGKILKKLGNKLFLVKCENGKEITADIGARFRNVNREKKKSRIIEGDKVVIEITVNDLEKGQIVGFSKS
jgi:translation initiation factor IF-1